MYRSIRIKNFRCFRDFNIQGLQRVNLLVGRNNVGKTSFLEALYLHLGANNPELPLRLAGFRGIEGINLNSDECWAWLFHNMVFEKPIEIISDSDDGLMRTQSITVSEPRIGTDDSSNGSDESQAYSTLPSGPRDLLIEYTDSSGRIDTARATPGEGVVNYMRGDFRPKTSGVYLAARTRFLEENARRFSRLAVDRREEEVVEAMHVVEPALKRLVVLSPGKEPMLYGDTGFGRLIPVQNMGSGTLRLLEIALDLATVANATLLIDEIESGFHHSILEDVWTLIGTTARRLNIQVFCTTHSLASIRAAHAAFSELTEPGDLATHRIERRDSDLTAVTYDDGDLAAAIEADLEIR